jgi:AcrR family transcriptional regulator
MVQEVGTEVLSTRDRVRRAALELFGEKGYDGASMSDLAERVGVAKPSLYNYYRSKEDLLLDLVEQAIRDWDDFCMAPFAAGGSFERQLGGHFRLVLEFARERPNQVAIFHLASTHVQGDLAARVQSLVSEFENQLTARVRERLVEAVASGELPQIDPAEAQLFLATFFHGLLFLQTNCPQQAGDVAGRLPAIWTYLYRALSGRAPRETLFA